MELWKTLKGDEVLKNESINFRNWRLEIQNNGEILVSKVKILLLISVDWVYWVWVTWCISQNIMMLKLLIACVRMMWLEEDIQWPLQEFNFLRILWLLVYSRLINQWMSKRIIDHEFYSVCVDDTKMSFEERALYFYQEFFSRVFISFDAFYESKHPENLLQFPIIIKEFENKIQKEIKDGIF